MNNQLKKGETRFPRRFENQGNKGTKVALTRTRRRANSTAIIAIRSTSPRLRLSCRKHRTDCSSNCIQEVALIKSESVWGKEIRMTNGIRQWTKFQKKMATKSIQGLVVDMRDNPGGFSGKPYIFSSWVSPKGKIVVKQESTTPGESKEIAMCGASLRYTQSDPPASIKAPRPRLPASSLAMQDYKEQNSLVKKSIIRKRLCAKKGGSAISKMDQIYITVAKWIWSLPSGYGLIKRRSAWHITVANTVKKEIPLRGAMTNSLRQLLSEW